MKKFRIGATALIAAVVLSASVGLAAEEVSTADLVKRLEELELEVKILKSQLELKKEDANKKTDETPVITASAKEGFSIQSSDDAFKIRVRGYAQVDSRFFTDNRKDIGTTDTFTARRVRPLIEGTVFRDYDFNITPSFDSGTAALQDAYIEYKYFPEAKIRAGKFKEPFGLERLQSITNINFVELGYPTALAPNRDVGVQLSGDLWEGNLSYAVGIFNGTADGASVDTDNNNDKDVAARVFAHPFKASDIQPLKGLGVGIASTYGHHEGSTLPTLRSPGQATVFNYGSTVSADGPHSRLGPQFYYYWNALGILGEYTLSDQEIVRTASGNILREQAENEAWQIIASYVLTGEDASFKGVTPRQPFSLKDGTWGAWELVGRYGVLDIDNEVFTQGFANANTAVTEAQSWALGLNWYLNRNVKLLLDYERTEFTGGALLEDRETENAILSRFQFSY